MSEQLTAPPLGIPPDSDTEEAWQAVAAEYLQWHEGLQPHVETNLRKNGLAHLVGIDADLVTPQSPTDDTPELITQIGGKEFQENAVRAYAEHKSSVDLLDEAEASLVASQQAFDERSSTIRWRREGRNVWARLGRVYHRVRTRKEQAALRSSRASYHKIKLAKDRLDTKRVSSFDMPHYFDTALLEATAAGISIHTQDPYQLEAVRSRAQWKLSQKDADPNAPVEAIDITKLSPEQLAENAARYPEMSWDLDPAFVAQIKEALLKLPLLHSTSSTRFNAGGGVSSQGTPDTPVSQSVLQELGIFDDVEPVELGLHMPHNTYLLDKQLNLDEYVFMSWGRPHSSYLEQCILIDPKILFDEACVVTPQDIADQLRSHKVSLSGVSQMSQLAIIEEAYLSTVVSGKDWLEIIARRYAKEMLENPTLIAPIELRDTFTLGEIKYRREIPRWAILGVMQASDLEEYKTEVAAMTEGMVGW